jgi:molybdenum cofactor synthesis domain-containing protein
VLTISDSASRGEREDRSGPAVRERLAAAGWDAEIQVLPDEHEAIVAGLRQACDSTRYSAVFTTGGTGIAPRDVTPEATRAVIEREVPGLAEWMRLEGMKKTDRAILSRGVCGTRGGTLIVNLPGSTRGAVESLDAISHLLPHVVDLLEGRTEHGDAGETTPSATTSQH